MYILLSFAKLRQKNMCNKNITYFVHLEQKKSTQPVANWLNG